MCILYSIHPLYNFLPRSWYTTQQANLTQSVKSIFHTWNLIWPISTNNITINANLLIIKWKGKFKITERSFSFSTIADRCVSFSQSNRKAHKKKPSKTVRSTIFIMKTFFINLRSFRFQCGAIPIRCKRMKTGKLKNY